MAPTARYDTIADWYEGWVGDAEGFIAEAVGELLPPTLGETRVLDVACGHGRAARALARLGAAVVGVDMSSEMIARAESVEAEQPLGITYITADVGDTNAWWDGIRFDGAVCEMALMDIDDLEGTLRAVARTVRADGWLVISMVPPFFPGNEAGLSSWSPQGTYFDEGWWTSADHNPDGVRSRVGSSHRTISTYLNALLDAGFTIERVVEPPEPVPTYLLLRGRRGAVSNA